MNKQFRIWDGETLHYAESLKDHANHYLQFGSAGFWLYNAEGYLITSTLKGGICSQFTGFYDSEKKMIYEGDILSDVVDTDEGMVESFKQVYMAKGAGCWALDNSFKQDKIHGGILSVELKDFTYKLAGNIYENPELLKVEMKKVAKQSS